MSQWLRIRIEPRRHINSKPVSNLLLLASAITFIVGVCGLVAYLVRHHP